MWVIGTPGPTAGKRRGRLSVEAIVEAAQSILDEQGLDKLTTTALARRLGVSQPSLYSHFASLEELQQEIAARGARELSGLVANAIHTDGVTAAGHQGNGDAALIAMASAYRDYVRRHPDRYLLQLSALRSKKFVEANERSAEAVRGVLRSYGLTEPQVREAHVAFRAAVHGFVHLEVRNALAAQTSEATSHFDFFVGLFAAGLREIVKGPATASTR